MQVETVDINDLKEHPKNYKKHPDDQLKHIISSIEEHGFYRNIVIAKDNTILAGHGVYQACKKMNKKELPVIRLDIEHDSPQALKVLTSDNEIQNLAEVDDRALSEILKEILDVELDLTGTGFDEDQLSALIYTTRPATEIASHDSAKEWVGMADYETAENKLKLIVFFDSQEDKDKLFEILDIKHITQETGSTTTIYYPDRPHEDKQNIKFVLDE